MNNIQLFRREEVDVKNFALWLACHNHTMSGLSDYFNDAYGNKKLAEVIYSGEHADFFKLIKKSIFIKCFSALLESANRIGSFETLTTIIKAIFGHSANVVYSVPAPGILSVDITQHSSDSLEWVTVSGGEIKTLDDEEIIFVSLLNKIYIDEIINLFKQFFCPAGIIYKININYA